MLNCAVIADTTDGSFVKLFVGSVPRTITEDEVSLATLRSLPALDVFYYNSIFFTSICQCLTTLLLCHIFFDVQFVLLILNFFLFKY